MIDQKTFEILRNFSPLRKTLCIGRPDLNSKIKKEFFTWQKCLRSLGATDINVLDYDTSGDIKHDLNNVFIFEEKYHTIFDCGTMEHVLNIGACLQSYAKNVKIGGQIIIVAATDSMQTHGYYQINPQTFYSFFNANGFETHVYSHRIGPLSRLVLEKEQLTQEMRFQLPRQSICVAHKLENKPLAWPIQPCFTTPHQPKKFWRLNMVKEMVFSFLKTLY